MIRKFIVASILLGSAGALLQGLVALAQTLTPPGKYIATEQWRKDLDASQPALGIVAGQTATIVPNVVVRRRQAGPNNASVHTAEGDKQYVTEIYQILEGRGTYVTGGTMPDPADRTAGIKGGESHDVKRLFVGDSSLIPRTLSVNPSLTIMALATRVAERIHADPNGYLSGRVTAAAA